GALVITIHQILILLTGNYTFFNLLTISLCLLQLDDSVLARFFPTRMMDGIQSAAKPVWMLRPVLISLLALLIGYLNVVQLSDQLLPGRLLFVISRFAYRLEPLRLVNGYGLFAVMTTTRPEIIIEGSTDGQSWQPYEFKYKAGDLARSPVWVEPFQPRLDWQ